MIRELGMLKRLPLVPAACAITSIHSYVSMTHSRPGRCQCMHIKAEVLRFKARAPAGGWPCSHTARRRWWLCRA